MHEKKRRVRCELTAIFNGRFERALMSAEPLRPNGRKNLLASDPHYRPSKKSGNNAQNDSYHRFLHRPCPAVATLLQVYFSGCPMTTFSAHTASPPPPSRTPAGSRASSRHASIPPRTTSAHGPLAWDARRTRTHRSIPAPPTPAGASHLPRTVLCPTPA